jgi:hypothetical protein
MIADLGVVGCSRGGVASSTVASSFSRFVASSATSCGASEDGAAASGVPTTTVGTGLPEGVFLIFLGSALYTQTQQLTNAMDKINWL